ncbi:translocation protein TolB [Anatilimnocola aggregata]|uniref:Translocation protein TolB n=1 Tax=Anatilimnocola aggregata TaxID=2528021 RepID=A0A517YFC1_9BACT|nr:WD40 repeat domain-containing protein [Anatilimnocola aggregata]QDU28928.1 translocation protein TolB [Anatilimnocola aggregata]
MNESSQGVITIRRPRRFVAAALSDFIVRSDGQKIGRVEWGARADFTVAPGEHMVDVSMDWGWLRPQRVVVDPGTRTELIISGRSGAAWKICLPAFFAIVIAIAFLAVLRQFTSFTDANWLLRSAVGFGGFAVICAGYWFVTRKLGSEYWDYWAAYTLELAGATTANVERGRRLAAWLGVACLGLVPVWSLSAQEPKLRATLQGHTNAVVSVAFSPDSKTLASASYDGTLKLWDMTTGKERATLGEYKGCLGCVAFSPDGKTLASGAIGSPVPLPDLKQVKLWDVATGKVRATLEEDAYFVHSVAFSPDGKTLASVNGDVTLWDLATNKERATLQGHTEEDQTTSEPAYGVESVVFSPDGKTLAAASHDMTIKVWDAATAKRSTLQGHTHAVYSVAFSSDSKTLASASGDKTVRLWDLATNKERAILKGHTESVVSVAFSPDGKILASASHDKTVKLWDVATGTERATLLGTESVMFVAFSPDGRMLASAGGTTANAPGELKVWDIASGM